MLTWKPWTNSERQKSHEGRFWGLDEVVCHDDLIFAICISLYFHFFCDSYSLTQPQYVGRKVGGQSSRVFWLINPCGAGWNRLHYSREPRGQKPWSPALELRREVLRRKRKSSFTNWHFLLSLTSHSRRRWMRAYGRRVVSRAVKSEPQFTLYFPNLEPGVQM